MVGDRLGLVGRARSGTSDMISAPLIPSQSQFYPNAGWRVPASGVEHDFIHARHLQRVAAALHRTALSCLRSQSEGQRNDAAEPLRCTFCTLPPCLGIRFEGRSM